MIKVSVIVPVFNGEMYLDACLESLVHQTLQDIEIIVVNDGSTDKTQTIIDQHFSKHPAKIKSYIKENGGIADTRNFGLSKVSGEYFAFLDSDDTAEITMLESMYTQAKKMNAQLVISDFVWVYPHKTKYSSDGPYPNNKELLTNMFATLWNKLYLSSWVKSLPVQFPNGYRYEDASFLYKIVPFLTSWTYLNQSFVNYFQRSGSITHNHNERVKDMLFVFNDLLEFYKQHNFYDQYRDELEYLFVRFFLGNSFLRTLQIADSTERRRVLRDSIDLIYRNFPNWKNNSYINKGNSAKNVYFKIINRDNYRPIAFLIRLVVLFNAYTTQRTFK